MNGLLVIKKIIDATLVPLSIILGSLSLIALIVNSNDIDLANTPQYIYESYRIFIDKIYFYLVENWIDVDLPNYLKDLLAFWLFCSGLVYRYDRLIGHEDPIGWTALAGPLAFWGAWDACFGSGRDPRYFMYFFLLLVFGVLHVVIVSIFFLWNYNIIKSLYDVVKI